MRLERVNIIEEMSKDFMALPPFEQLVEGIANLAPETMSTLAFLRTTILGEISATTVKYVQRAIPAPCFIIFKEKQGNLIIWAKSDADGEISANDMAVANWSVTHNAIAGAGTETLPSIPYFFFPVKSQEETIGVIGIRHDYKNLLPEQRRLLGTISNLTSLAAIHWVKA